MSNRWTSPTVEHGRSAIETKTVDEAARELPRPDGVDPSLGVSESDRNLLDNLHHQLALDAAEDPRPNTPEGGR